jgi:hypothetical protein
MVEGAPGVDREEAMIRSPQGMVEASAVHGDAERLISVGLLSQPQHRAVGP